MADIMQPQSSYSDPWQAYIYQYSPKLNNSSGGNGTPLSLENINSQQSNNTPANTSPQGNFNAQSSVPVTNTSAPAIQTVGNTQVTSNSQLANAANDPLGSVTSSIPSTNNNNNAGITQTTGPASASNNSSGLSSNLFQQGVSKLANRAFSGISNTIDEFGGSLGFSTGVGSSLEGAAASGTIGGEAVSAVPGITAGNLSSAGMLSSGTGLAGGAEGAASPGFLGATGTLSGTLGAAGIGFFGGSELAKLIGGNQLGGGIGGALGAGAGYAFGGAGAAALGLELGAWAGPVGALVGGVGGALIGSAFGGPKPTSASEFLLSPTASGGVGSESFGSKGNSSGFNEAMATNFDSVLQSASSTLGINFNPQSSVHAGFNSLHSGGPQPGFIQVTNGGNYYFDPSDTQSVGTAYYGAVTELAAQGGYKDTTALYNWFYGQGPVTDPNSTYNAANMNASPITIAPKAS